MNNIVINDLEMNQELDKHAVATITGGKGESAVLRGAKTTVGGALVVASFQAGHWFGEQLDKEYGVSDKISDWASENIPWPW